ncbi:MAG: hypothetical protein AB1938_20400 [Myxococcota bacterium]
MRRFVIGVALALASCGPAPDLESQLTITQGLYGQLTKRCDGDGCVGAPLEGTPVGWFSTSPWSTDGGVDPAPLQETKSGKNGLYEFPIESNTKGYVAVGQLEPTTGVHWLTATSVTVPKGLARVDWRGGPGPEGTWTDVR